MDSRTVYMLGTLYLAVTAWLVAVGASSYPSALRRDGRRWAGAVALLAAGMGLVALRGMVPDGFSVLGAHATSVAGLSVFYHLLRRFQGLRPRLLWVYLPLPLALASACYFLFVSPNYGLRVAVFSAITAGQVALCATVMARGDSPAPRAARLVVLSFASCSALLLVRTWASLSVAPAAAPATILRASFLEQFIVVGIFVGLFVLSFSFVILSNERLTGQLARQATVDSLTGCLNRRTIEELAEREAARARRHGASLAVVLVDLDRLKRLNDRHGHGAGDAALRHVGSVLQQTMRAADAAGRYGGDEFLLVMPDTAGAEARIACERARAGVGAQTADFQRTPLTVTLSMGIACAQGPDIDLAALLAAADAALYAAKVAGGDGVRSAAASSVASARHGR
jgi:diguanylate cyclase (GGDEF)-like protein